MPSVEELFGIQRDSHAAFTAGHISELWAVISDAERAASKAARARYGTPKQIVLSNGSIDSRVQPNDLIALPAWAFRIVCNTAMSALELGQVPKRRKGQKRWRVQYRDSLMHWHRYVVVRRAMEAGHKQKPSRNEQPTAFEVASDALKGTAFGASPAMMEKSFSRVKTHIKRGEHWRYDRDQDALYAQLLDRDVTIVVKC